MTAPAPSEKASDVDPMVAGIMNEELDAVAAMPLSVSHVMGAARRMQAHLDSRITAAVTAERERVLAILRRRAPCSICSGTGRALAVSFSEPSKKIEQTCGVCRGSGSLAMSIDAHEEAIRAAPPTKEKT